MKTARLTRVALGFCLLLAGLVGIDAGPASPALASAEAIHRDGGVVDPTSALAPKITVGALLGRMQEQISSIIQLPEHAAIMEALGYDLGSIYTGFAYPPGISLVAITGSEIVVHGEQRAAEDLAASITSKLQALSSANVVGVEIDPDGVSLVQETVAGTREWIPGRNVTMYNNGIPVADCSLGYHLVLYSGGFDYWYTVTAGHCAFGGVTSNEMRYRNFADSFTFGTGSPLSGYTTPDVSVWYVGATLPGVQENNSSRSVWDFCNGTTCVPNGSGSAHPVQAKVSYGIGTVLCRTGQTTGTGCGQVTFIEPSGRTHVNNDYANTTNCGSQAGDSGGPWFFIQSGNAYAAGTHVGGYNQVPQRAGCAFSQTGLQSTMSVFDLAATIEATVGAYFFTYSTGF